VTIDGEFVFEGTPSDVVWNFLTDPDRIASCLPGCEKLVSSGEGSFEMTLSIGIGAIRGTFMGTIRLHDMHPTREYGMTVSGKGVPGFINGEGTVRLDSSNGRTALTYSGNVSAGGPIASVGQRMISGAARMVIGQFFRCVAQKLK